MDYYNKTNKTATQTIATTSLNEKTIQNKAIALQDNRPASVLQRKANNTGLPDALKSGIENLSGHSMDDVKVHYNSDKPAQLHAHAYAQGTDIHIASGQEKHLPHEAWHVIQQKQGRVKPTLQMKGKVNVNDDKGLEKEADVMGAKALQRKETARSFRLSKNPSAIGSVAQLNEHEEHGLVPPTTHGRSEKYKSPSDPATTTKGHHHAVPRKDLTRFERMIDRIGRILATSTNVHVAVALDDTTLVLSVNQESEEENKKLEKIAPKLKNIVNGEDPLEDSHEKRITGERRTKDISKTRSLLENKYTDDETGVETNEEVSSQLKRLIAAINAGLIDNTKYHKGTVGIYIVPTSTAASESTFNMHGELKVTKEIQERRKKGNYSEKEVYIGGTLADCFACNASHKIVNEEIKKEIKHNNWSFYSGGTHGGLFPGYRASKAVSRNKARFQQFTGEQVLPGSIEKVDSIDKASKSSLNYNSDSEDEDIIPLSDYAKERKKLIVIQKNLNDSTKKLMHLELEITAIIEKQRSLLAKLKDLKISVEDIVQKTAIKNAEEALLSAQAESEKAQKKLEEEKEKLQKAIEDLNEAKEKVNNAPLVKGKPKKPGIKLEFRAGKLGEQGWTTGESFNKKALEDLSKSSGYAAAYANQNNANDNLEKQKKTLQLKELKVEQLQAELQHLQQPGEDLKALPSKIEQVEENLTKLLAEKENLEEHISQKEDEKKIAKTARSHAAKHLKVQKVKGKLDLFNQKAIEDDQADSGE